MKKILAFVLAAVMLFSFASCSNAGGTDEDASTPAAILLADFRKIANDGETSPEAIANKLVENDIIEFSPVVMPVNEGYLNGFSSDITGFDDGAVFAPMIGAIPFVGYVFTVSGDVETFKNQLKESADLRWNICTEADEMVCDSVGSTVFFVMSPLSFEEE